MALFDMNKGFSNRVIKTSAQDFRFKYNTQSDYFYFDAFDTDGNIISLHNKVVTGFNFGGVLFTSDVNASYATADNIESFKMDTGE